MAKFTKRRLLLIEAETTYGTDPSPETGTSSDGKNLLVVTNLEITPQSSDVVSRDVIRPVLGASEQILANTKVEVSFTCELTGSGSAQHEVAFAPALKACGFKMTSSGTPINKYTYKPSSLSTLDSITIHYNTDGTLHKILGARGNCEINCAVGEIPTITFNFTGHYVDPTETPIVGTDYSAVRQASPLIFKNGNTSDFKLLNYAGKLQNLSFDFGNSLVYRELITNASSGTGSNTKEVLVTDRASTGTVSIEAPPLSGSGSHDFFADALNDTISNASGFVGLKFKHGTDPGNKVTFESARVDIGDVNYGDSDGIVMLEIPYTLIPNALNTTSNTTDELELVFE